jgi:transcriptional regulator with XRE-family HTH domain
MDEILLGRSMRAIRIRKRLTQEQLARRIGVSRGVVARLEQGHGSRVSVAMLDRVALALGARLVVRLSWQGEGLDRLLDGRHAATVEEVVRILRSAGWELATEVSFNEFGERGSIDILAAHLPTRRLLVIEVKTAIADAQDLLSTLDRKVRLAPRIARGRGWPASTVSKLLVVVESRTNRQRIDALATTFEVAFPSRTWAVRRWIDSPNTTSALHGIWFLRTGTEAVVTQRVRARRARATHERRPEI